MTDKPYVKPPPPPPPCRSGDCGALGDFEVIVVPPGSTPSAARRVEGRVWKGVFCHEHLNRVLPARLQMLSKGETMTVIRLRR